MKKPILLLLGLVMVISLSAQEFKLGIKAGANFTSLKSDQKWLDSDNNTGYLIGAWARIGGAKVHLQPEVYFTNKQTTVYVPPANAAEDLIKGDLKFNNIDVPVLVGTKFPVGPVNMRVQAGPLFSFVIDEKATFQESISNTANEALNSYKDNFAAIVGGFGIDIASFTIDARYEYGLGNISKYEGTKQTLNLWTIGIGYRLF